MLSYQSRQVIKGWDNGLINMCPGEKRRLTIPASQGYGDRGAVRIDSERFSSSPGFLVMSSSVSLKFAPAPIP